MMIFIYYKITETSLIIINSKSKIPGGGGIVQTLNVKDIKNIVVIIT